MQNQKRGTDVLIYKTEVGKDLWLPGDKGEGLNGKFGLTNNTTVYIIDNNKNRLYSTGISTQCSVMIFIGKELRKKKNKTRVNMCMSLTALLSYTIETNTTYTRIIL